LAVINGGEKSVPPNFFRYTFCGGAKKVFVFAIYYSAKHIFAAMSQGEAYWSVVEPVWASISIHGGPSRFLREFDAAPVVARTLFAAHWCHSEVCNGGLYQFFNNSTGVLAPEAVRSFHALGMPKLSAVVAQGVSWFGATYPREWSLRRSLLATFGGKNTFDEMNKAFFKLIRRENGGFLRAADIFALENDRV